MLPKISKLLAVVGGSSSRWDITIYKAFTVSPFFVLNTADRLIYVCKRAFTNYVEVYGI